VPIYTFKWLDWWWHGQVDSKSEGSLRCLQVEIPCETNKQVPTNVKLLLLEIQNGSKQ